MSEQTDIRFDVLLPVGDTGGAGGKWLAQRYAYPDGTGQVWVRANMVTTVDGAAADTDGRTASISGPADRQVFHVLRGLADVLLVGAGTARTERYGPAEAHPDLAASRLEQGRRSAAVVVQVSRSGRVQAGRGMFDSPGAALAVVPASDPAAVARAAATAGSDAVLAAPDAADGGIDLTWVLSELGARGLPRVLCEGGPALLGRLVALGLLDELCLTTTPVLAGGADLRLLGSGTGSPPHDMRLESLLHADHTLFTRWQNAP